MQIRHIGLVTAFLIVSCAVASAGKFERVEAASHTIYVLSHGWHTGIAVRQSDVPENVWPERTDFVGKTYLEVGWGDEAFYGAADVTLGVVLRAAFTPTRSVLHVVGFDAPVEQFFAGSEVVAVQVARQDLLSLLNYIDDSVARKDETVASALGPGIYGTSRFYPANGTYSLIYNCNTWVADALRQAGLPVESRHSGTAGGLMRQVRQFGLVIRGPR